jgi:sulfate adenylyltransferase subunit 1
VAVNKMDLAGWNRRTFENIRSAYDDLARRLAIADFHILPLSALHGDNVVTASAHTPWYSGPPLLTLLENLPVSDDGRGAPLRLPVQWVLRHGGERIDGFRGYAGRVASGTLRVGETLLVQPSGIEAKVAGLIVSGRRVEEAVAGDAVTVVPDRDVDVSRGDVLSHPGSPARIGRQFEAELCWLDATPLNPARRYLIKHGARVTSARIQAVHARRDIHELREVPDESGTLTMNDIGRVSLLTRETLAVDRYEELPANGAFILIDEASNQTAAAGMLR